MSTFRQLITDHIDIWAAADNGKKSGRGRNSNSAVSVYGVKKLRELILRMAISGKLLPQDTSDIPTPLLTKKIGIKKKNLNEVLLNEFSIPDSWEWHYISDLCDLKTGATPSTTKTEYYGGSIRWLVSGDIHKNEIYDCDGRITDAGLNNSNCKILPKNSVLIALNGQGKTRATVAILRVEAACNQSLVAMTTKYPSLISSEFILINLRYRYFEIRDITGQNQRRGLNMGLIKDLSISVPPLAEQQRIVAKVDELMALCDQMEAQHISAAESHERLVTHLLDTLIQSENSEEFNENWQRIATHFDTLFTTETSVDALKETLLQLAVMGKLVPQDPNDEPASELLKRIKAEKSKLIAEGKIKKSKLIAEGKIKKGKALLPLTKDDKPFNLPKGWGYEKLGIIAKKLTDGSHNPPNDVGYGIPMLSSQNVNLRQIDFSKPSRFVSIEDFEIENSRTKIEPGDVLLTIVGSLGRSAVVQKNTPRFVLQRSVAVISVALVPEFMNLQFCSSLCIKYYELHGKGTAQKGIYLGKLAEMPIVIPPIAEQQRIVTKVDELMTLCDQLKAHIVEANQLQQQLADTVVKQYAA